jgi:TonB family protein
MGRSPNARRVCLLRRGATLSFMLVLFLNGGYGQTGTDADTNTIFKVGEGVSPPVPIKQPTPKYSKQARREKYEGTCVLWLVVDADGRPRDIKVQRTLGLGLDEEAIEAVKRWRFKPAMKEGQPVSVRISVQVDFHLY